MGSNALTGELEFLGLVMGFLVIVLGISWFIVTSSFGRVLTAIREDEQAIEVFGYQARITSWRCGPSRP